MGCPRGFLGWGMEDEPRPAPPLKQTVVRGSKRSGALEVFQSGEPLLPTCEVLIPRGGCRSGTVDVRGARSGRPRQEGEAMLVREWMTTVLIRSEEHTSELQSLRHLVC